METINLNGKEYVLKSEFDKVNEDGIIKARKISELEQAKPKESKLSLNTPYVIMDSVNVCALFRVPNGIDIEKIDFEMGKFKESNLTKCVAYPFEDISKDHPKAIITPNGTRFSDEYYKMALKLFSLLEYRKVKSCYLYEHIDAEGKFVKDFPIILFNGINLGLLIAPRVEN